MFVQINLTLPHLDLKDYFFIKFCVFDDQKRHINIFCFGYNYIRVIKIEIKAFWRKKVKYKQKENCILDVDHNLSKNNKNKEKNKSKIILS